MPAGLRYGFAANAVLSAALVLYAYLAVLSLPS
jgi:hypothetical protein